MKNLLRLLMTLAWLIRLAKVVLGLFTMQNSEARLVPINIFHSFVSVAWL